MAEDAESSRMSGTVSRATEKDKPEASYLVNAPQGSPRTKRPPTGPPAINPYWYGATLALRHLLELLENL